MALRHESEPFVAVAVVLLIPATIVFGMRLYVRGWMRKSWGFDDWLLVFAYPSLVLEAYTLISAATHGLGAKSATLSDANLEGIRKDLFILEVGNCLSCLAIKLSICVTLMRIAGRKPIYLYILYVNIALFSTTIIGTLIFIHFQCRPTAAWWDLNIPGAVCLSPIVNSGVNFTYTTVGILTDWVCSILPLFLIWSLQMNRNMKLASALLLGLGGLASIASTIRLKYLVDLLSFDDYSLAIAPFFVCGMAEPGLGMIAACSSALKPLIDRFLKKGDGSEGHRYPSRSNDPSDGWRRHRADGTYELSTSKNSGTLNTMVVGGHVQKTNSNDLEDVADIDNRSSRQLIGKDIYVTTDISLKSTNA
ncbi:unnamed protein product [Clonostachys byssicola]|uniref:Rhodopsin domain-containing protein n=1 Tax=Clonostachys byssicola TaxID=160290 RepID=A0A9N9U671_9HYPO|nr:unnamed protein product [Clonostachys byssicola]